MLISISPRHKRIIKICAYVTVFVTIFCLIMTYFRKNMVPVFVNTCDAEVRAIAINAVNNSASTVITEDLTYEDLFEIQKNTQGEITLIHAKSPKINRLARELALLTQHNLESVEENEIGVALGTLTGITMFIGLGPQIKIKIVPIGVANCDFVSEFVSAGINQTLHKIYIDIVVTIMVALPIADITVDTKSEILICENLIIGKVPETYLNLGRITEGINLVP